ncbi:MAG: hypothetical protein NTW19_00185, partial [Planctomycetota bacterium]|nr:hypothetical protein [Planctomycetota bacterium]
DLPMYWHVVGRPARATNPNFLRPPLHAELITRPGYPTYNTVKFDTRFKTSGDYSLYLGLEGGNAGAFLEMGSIPAVPEADYLITASVRTTHLKRARARILGFFVDNQGKRIEASVASSGPINTDEQWTSVTLRLSGQFNDAAWLGLDLELNQPSIAETMILGKHAIQYQEVKGGAWFDDVTVTQLPRLRVSTQSPNNVIRMPDQPRLSVDVHDLTGRSLVADFRVFDIDRKQVAAGRQAVGDGAPLSWTWLPPLERAGWYLYDLAVTDPSGQAVTETANARLWGAFLWLGPDSQVQVRDSDRFALVAQGSDDAEMELLPGLLDSVGLDTLVLNAFDGAPGLAAQDDRMAMLDRVLQTLQSRGRQVTLDLAPLPRDLLSADAEPLSVLGPLGRPARGWLPYMAPLLLRQGQRVRNWQLGPAGAAEPFDHPQLVPTLAGIAQELHDLAPQPQIVVPWRIDHIRRPGLPAGVQLAMEVPESIPAERIREYLAPWQTGTPASCFLHFREPPANAVSQASRVEDLSLRMVHAWEAGVAGMAINRPWTRGSDSRASLMPDPLLGAFASVSHRLAGRHAVGRLPLGEGLEAIIFDGPAGGMIAAWNRSAPEARAKVDLYMGVEPVAIDIWGNRTKLPTVNGRQQHQLTRTPVFFEGIDPQLALFRAAFKIEPAFIESTQIVHEGVMTISNPFARTISGYVQVTDPADWRIDPRRSHFAIAAGQTTTIPMHLSFPVSEPAGHKRLVARFDFTADQRYQVDLNAGLELGLRNVDFDASLALVPDPETGKTDVVVTQLIANTGSRPLSLYAFATLPGHPRQERVVSRLEPGQSIVRRFRFADAAESLKQSPLRVGLRETEGPAMLTRTLRFEGE